MQKLGRGPLWLCHISRSDLGHESSGDRTLQTGTIYLGTLGSFLSTPVGCPEVLVGALCTSLQIWPSVFVCFQRCAGLLGTNSQLIRLAGLPVAAQVQPGQRRPGLAIHLLLQEENRLMAGQAPTGWCRKDHILPLFWHYNMTYKGKRQELVAYSSARQDLKQALLMVLRCLQTSEWHK